MGGKLDVGFSLQGKTEFKDNDVKASIKAGLHGSAIGYGSTFGRCHCSIDRSHCNEVLAAALGGSIEIAVYDIGCHKIPKLRVSLEFHSNSEYWVIPFTASKKNSTWSMAQL